RALLWSKAHRLRPADGAGQGQADPLQLRTDLTGRLKPFCRVLVEHARHQPLELDGDRKRRGAAWRREHAGKDDPRVVEVLSRIGGRGATGTAEVDYLDDPPAARPLTEKEAARPDVAVHDAGSMGEGEGSAGLPRVGDRFEQRERTL